MFHEVGAADSIANIVCAAVVIAAIGPATWSVAPLPIGGGRVRTAHGVMPVPAPATSLLLDGFDIIDDGVSGERITPTGAAILRHLGCKRRHGLKGRIDRTGTRFGTRSLPAMSNILRVLTFEPTHEGAGNGEQAAAWKLCRPDGAAIASRRFASAALFRPGHAVRTIFA